MKGTLKKLGVAVAASALALTSLTVPAKASDAKTTLTFAETRVGGVGIKQVEPPWFNSGSLTQGVLFRGLFKANPDMTTVKPDLASGHKVSKDGKTVTITMKSGLKWSDGKAITADDVVWSINTALRVTRINANYSNAFKLIDGASAVTAANKVNMSGLTAKGNEITIKLGAPQPLLIPILAQFMILPKHILEDEDLLRLDTNKFWLNPVSSGPFKVGTLSPDNFITLVPNTNYEGPKSKITQINVVSSAALLADARSGKIDYFITQDADTIRGMRSVNSFRAFQTTGAPFHRYWVFNLTDADSPIKNVKTREALKYGVDWEGIVKAAYPHGKVINSGVPSGLPFHLRSIPKYKYDVAKAKALLAEAKFDFSKTIRLRHYHFGPADIIFMSAVAQQMQALGMKVELTRFVGDATTELYTNRNYDIALKGLSTFDVSEWFSEYSNPNFARILGAQPKFAELNSQLATAVTLKQRAAALKALQELEQDTLLKLPVHLLPAYVYVSKRVSGTPTKYGPWLYLYENNFLNWTLS
jgi:peptide/nickel transport system substrate-binding protein